MKLLDIVNKSTFCSIGCITKPQDIEILERYVLHNLDVISKFPKIVIAHTKTDNITQNELNEYNNIWIKHFKNKCTVINRKNYGHTFGFTDLDRTVMFESKRTGYEWIWKSTNDVLLTEKIFDVEMEDSDFFFLQGHGTAGINLYYKNNINSAVENFKDNGYQYFFPQTNFFITNVSKTDNLIDTNKFNELYNKYINDPDYGKTNQLEYKYMLSESVLVDFVKRNSLKCKHLLSKDSYKRLLEVILMFKIADSSHKNIFFTECGVCHFHYFNETIIEI